MDDLLISYDYVGPHQPRKVVTDSGLDGQADITTDFAYDQLGLLIQEQTDANGDGRPDLLIRYGYDAGQRLSWRSTTAGLTERFEYEASGHLLRITKYYGGNDRPDSFYDLTWQDDLPIRYEFDDGADGVIEDVQVFSYNDLRQLSRAQEGPPNGPVDRETTFNYEAHGWLAREREFLDGQLHYTISFEYDPVGRVVREVYVGDEPPELQSYTYSCPNG